MSEQAGTAHSGAHRRKRVFSGIQPSGTSHIGNYLGAIRNWVTQQEQYDNVFCIVNLHALTLPTTRDSLVANTITMANTLLASGIDPEQSILFLQSDVVEHPELSWLLNSVTQFGELRRMTQFKDKSGGQDEGVSAALFDYPVLQAADILLYDTDLVPVGDDQKQHIELARDIAQRFNARYGETFVVPQPDIKPEGARIMALDDPTKKMSKSAGSAASYIALTDDADTITRKIKRAVTDSGSDVTAGPDKPALTNLLTIYSLFSGEPIPVLEERFAGRGYGAFKLALAELLVEALRPIQTRLAELEAHPEVAVGVLAEGAVRARVHAERTMKLVRDRMGLTLSAV
ncbi:MAG: tryptophanyl-tRNA synthetase [Thermomicrobiales bacterium]|jgi:tryptophanyl-tRNA synthetase|nr:tryptophanyl-tRNA synthetase [Thermomicrobiales bacterium]